MERHCQDRRREDAATIETMIPTSIAISSKSIYLELEEIHITIEQAEMGYAPSIVSSYLVHDIL